MRVVYVNVRASVCLHADNYQMLLVSVDDEQAKSKIKSLKQMWKS